MVWVAGIDGCRAGWFRASRETDSGGLRFDVARSLEDLMSRSPQPAVMGVDMPIGLPEAGDRQCGKEARARLGRPRSSSVFPVPVRAAIRARTREEASRITLRIDGRKVGAQSWAIWRKIRSLDDALAGDAALRSVVREVHPELSFWAWNGRKPIGSAKKSPQGRRARLALASEWLGDGVLLRARGSAPKYDLADDDVLDALAALWTAERIASGTAETVPATPPRDAKGLPMEIVF